MSVPLVRCDAMSETEEWRVVPSFPHLEASSAGRIRRCATHDPRGKAFPVGSVYKARSYRFGKRGAEYFQIHVSHMGVPKSHRVHRLVCEAFHGTPPRDKPLAAHRDGDSLNNTPSNLYWASGHDNAADRIRHGRQPCGEGVPLAKLTPALVQDIRLRLADGESLTPIARIYGVSVSAIYRIKYGKTWKSVPTTDGAAP